MTAPTSVTSVCVPRKWPLVRARRPQLTATGMFKMIHQAVRGHSDLAYAPHLSPCKTSHFQYPLTASCAVCTSHAAKRLAGVADALGKLADRLLAFGDGKFTPSPPPALLDTLTDELLVVASNSVRNAAAKCTTLNGLGPISGKAQLRLLAWVVADARGAIVPLEKALAETVGKRLDRQAKNVRDTVAAASEQAERMRAYVREELPPELHAEKIAAIDATEQRAIEAPRSEVYVGFHELDSLLPETYCSALADATMAVAPDGAAHGSDDGSCDEPKIAGVRSTWRLHEPEVAAAAAEYDQKDGSIPPDLVRALGADGVQLLWEYCKHRAPIGEEWWDPHLPFFARNLIREQTQERRWHTEDMERHESETAKMRETIREQAADLDEAQDEIERLQGELRDAKGREQGLRDALALLRV